MTARSASLFDAPTDAPLAAASAWLTGTLLGSVAIALCVIAVALVGLLLMSGRLAIREAVRVVIGCFVLLGAPIIAVGLRDAASQASGRGAPMAGASYVPPPPRALPPANYDPYAGASLRIP